MNELLSVYHKELIFKILSHGSVYERSLAEKAISGELTEDDVEVICNLISNEFMLNGITEDFEPNEYGIELESLLNTVNKNRLK
ncbi:hypothetical protein SAMN05518863_10714 [Candidatus Pantoea symbiotica]|jgi:hypothetical protein|uniref:Colicin immunity protein n=1 Tax=Candidatus Pantoea symbiotica TaxID=1884370 RepID=A0A1I3ZG59_9GAMM|nr:MULTISPECIES: hypothetical protein [Pantoea]KAJ9429976.1 hypothetical protein PMI39_020570 [Pantoea sp. YR343]MRT25582.1 hypothetical protein [Enterobacteriaceae bacterium RIT697]SFK43118.1 hypothetical protein SAMN05518863_10714 [Pantoea symbiotica]SFU93784.1 hypothetical protein SAMN05518864_107311 [Pantoea sp. YR525]